jgi:glycosyltransferase involved in cell wall biosynthesis
MVCPEKGAGGDKEVINKKRSAPLIGSRAQARDKNHKKVLMVSHAFPPGSGSAVHRPLKFIKFLPDYGWKPYIVTPKKNIEPLDYSLMKDVPEVVSVNEVLTLKPANLKAIAQKRYKSGFSSKLSYSCLRILLKLYGIIYYRIVVIDWHDGWIPFGFMKAREIVNKEDINVIFVDMEPPSTSLIGLLLKKVTGKPLVIDYHDPWTTSVYARHSKGVRKKIAEYLEHKILDLADRVTAGKEIIISEIMEKFPDLDKIKFLTINSGYDPDDFRGIEKIKEPEFVITYTGKLSEKFYYSPESFLYALGELIREEKIPKGDVKALFVGTVSSQYQSHFQHLVNDLNLENVVFNTGHVDRRKCAQYQINSHVLLYIIESPKGREFSYEFSGAVPSKLYEYMYTGNPILAIVPPGFEADLIKKTGTGFIAEPNNVPAVKELLYELYERYKKGTLKIDPDKEETSKYNRKILAGKLAHLFDEILIACDQER